MSIGRIVHAPNLDATVELEIFIKVTRGWDCAVMGIAW